MPWTKADVDKHKRGLSDSQKAQWVRVANSVRQQCLNDGGSEEECDATAIRQANGVVGNSVNDYYEKHYFQTNDYAIRMAIHQDKRHIVVPTIMMVEGVHNGSHGPLLHTITELGKFPAAWNGIPVCIDHPSNGREHISANSPEVIDQLTVGRVYNTRVEGSKLKAEAWIDEEKIRQVSPLAYAYIQEKRPLEVSVGVFTEEESKEGQWNGETYTAVARNHRPDHLALLPGGVGACSWADGCGVRVNQEGGEVVNVKDAIKELAREGFSFLLNQSGYRQLMEKIQNKLDMMDDNVKTHFLVEMFDNHFIYSVSREGEETLYKRTYQNNSDGSVEFTGEAVPVQRQVNYVTMSRFVRTKGGQTNMADEKKPCCPEKVELLVQSEHSSFEEKDREWLNSLEQEQIDKLVAPVADLDAREKVEKDAQEKEETETKGKANEEKVSINADQALQVLKDHLKTAEDFLNIAPEEMRDSLKSGLKLHKEKRAGLIETITAHTQVFSKDELENKGMDELEKLASMVPKPRNYSVFGAGNDGVTANKEEVLLPPGVGVEEKKQ